jgi:dephospho-CoA kinase
MLIVGLTGSIASGKSTVAGMLRARGFGVFDADATVHVLYEGEAARAIEAAFPGTTVNGAIDRARLAKAVLGHREKLERLEAIVHPLVKARRGAFFAAERARGAEMAFVEIPLLFETGAEDEVDATIVVSAPEEIMRARALERPGMTAEKLAAILARQTPDAEKRARADYVVDTGGEVSQTRAAVDRVIESLRRANSSVDGLP